MAAWLAAGVASAGQLSWRAVYLILAAVLAAVTVPAHALALRPPWPPRLAQRAEPAQASPRSGKTKGTRADRQVLASRAFLQLVTAATLCAFAQYAALVNLVPLPTGRGLSPALAAWALGLGGAGQVAGRLCYRALDARTGVRGRATAIIAAGAAVTLLLGQLPGHVRRPRRHRGDRCRARRHAPVPGEGGHARGSECGAGRLARWLQPLGPLSP